jgi:NAD(P)-dependent dehydrogenase (short-subunit alcohol dehydrogenase family)
MSDFRRWFAPVGVTDKFRLDGRTVLVTGASSGLGVAFALAAAEAGANVVVGARRLDKLEHTRFLVEQAGGHAIAVQLDVTRPAECKTSVDRAMTAFGRVDVLVNNAGIGSAIPALRETPDEFESVTVVNLYGCYWMAQECAAVMKPGSAIINISSVLGIKTAGLPQAAYTASKAAVLGLTRDLAQQWTGRRGIRVNAIVPGFFGTEMTDRYRPGYLESQIPRILSGRLGEPHEVAAAMVFLASDAASYITGQSLVVDGGFSIT